MLVVSEKLPDKSFFRRLNLIPKAYDAVADDDEDDELFLWYG